MQSTKRYFNQAILTIFLFCLMISGAQAAKPLWTFEPLTATSVVVPVNGTALVQYRVTNQSSKSHTLVMQPIPGVTQITTGLGVCGNPFVLAGNDSCILSLQINGSQLNSSIVDGPVVCQQGGGTLQCYRPSTANILNVTLNPVPGSTTLSASVSDLALSVTGISGLARVITITNTGANSAENLSVTSPVWPAGTTSTTTCGGTLAASSSCTITIMPGATASPDINANPCTTSPGTEPVPATITVNANNAPSTDINVLVLGYGCIYQGGYLFSVDDTTDNTGSIGGKVAALTDEPSTYLWAIVQDNTDATSQTDGFFNTNTLATPSGQYPAAQACLGKIDQGFDDWYLPAICELGRDSSSACDPNPNLYTNLDANNLGNIASQVYWSSTQISTVSAYIFNFANPGAGFFAETKTTLTPRRARCVRAFTPIN